MIMTKQENQINYLISTIRDSEIHEDKPIDEYLSLISDILCQFDTDIAIKVMDELETTFGEEAKYQSTSIKVNYGY